MSPTNLGNATAYVAGGSHIPIPIATDKIRRAAHKPQTPKPTGLDWSKLRADDPTTDTVAADVAAVPVERITWPCRGCGGRFDDLVKELCADCRFDADAKFEASPVVDITPSPAAPALSDAERAIVDRFENAPVPVELTSVPVEKEEAPVATALVFGILDRLIDDLATIRATVTTDLARIETALEQARLTLKTPVAGPEVPAPLTSPGSATGHTNARRCGSCDQAVALLVDDALCIRCDSALPADQAPLFETFQKPRPGVRGPDRARRTPRVDAKAIVDLYTNGEGLSVPEVANRLGHSAGTVRRQLRAADITIADGRTTHSGGRNRVEHTEQTVADVRRLYVDEQLSKTAVGLQLGLTPKQIDLIMRRHSIEARPNQGGNLDGAAPLKQRIAALGVTSREIKVWGLEHGLVTAIRRGIPSIALVDAYAAAHSTTSSTTDSSTTRPTQEDQPA